MRQAGHLRFKLHPSNAHKCGEIEFVFGFLVYLNAEMVTHANDVTQNDSNAHTLTQRDDVKRERLFNSLISFYICSNTPQLKVKSKCLKQVLVCGPKRKGHLEPLFYIW